MKILVTGATATSAADWCPLLLERGHDVRTTTTDPSASNRGGATEWRPSSWTRSTRPGRGRLRRGGRGVLPDPRDGRRRLRRDRPQGGHQLADGVRAHGVDRVVYLSGLVPDVAESELSEHIRSRLEVERILSDVPATVVVLRAAVLLGSGSTSFEIIRQVSERMPVHTVPSWMDSTVQPIAVVDVLEALVGALEYAAPRATSTWAVPSAALRRAARGLHRACRARATAGRRASVADSPGRHPGRQPHRRASADGRGPGREPPPRHGRRGRRLQGGAATRGTPPRGAGRGLPSLARSARPRPKTRTPWGPCHRTRPGPAAATTGPHWPRWSTRSRTSYRGPEVFADDGDPNPEGPYETVARQLGCPDRQPSRR